MEVAKALVSSFKLVFYASAKTCKGDDSTNQGNTKGWGHTNKLKQYKHTKYKPSLNKTHSAQPGRMTDSEKDVGQENTEEFVDKDTNDLQVQPSDVVAFRVTIRRN